MVNIAITGKGIISAIGNNTQEVLQSLKGKCSGIGEMRYLESVHHELPVGEVKLTNDEMKTIMDIPEEKEVSRTTLMGMIAVRQAIQDARINGNANRNVNRNERITFINGTTVGGMDVTEKWFNSFAESDEHIGCLKSHDCGSCTQDIAAASGIFTDCTTVSTACSSAANAIILGARLLKAGMADIVVAGGTEALSRFHLNGFNSLMILDQERCRPFDDTRAGLNLGEGAAYIVMETEEHARKRHADINAFLTGYGNACDAYHQTASSDNGEGAYRAMSEALAMACLDIKDIDYVNAHGTGTPNNDLSESMALKRTNCNAPISSTKAFTGHATSAAGAIEAVICLLAMRHHFIPANICWKNKMTDGIIPCMGKENVTLRHVLSNSFGFGGNDSALIFSQESVSAGLPAGDLSSTDDNKVIVAHKVEINNEEQLADIKRYVKPIEARRMGKIMKSSLLSSLQVLEKAGISTPDAIITATAMGSLEYSENLLHQLTEEGETTLKPTWFMQSTHNTIGSNIAIWTKCHGYNTTYSHGTQSLEWAMRDAELLLRSGKVKNVLVGLHDETTAEYRSLMERLDVPSSPAIHSVAMILSTGKGFQRERERER